jgi:hydrogenase/urease accessory protein HupE
MRNTGFWWRLVHLEPAVYRALVMAVFGLLIGLGLVVGADLPEQIVVAIGAIFALIQGLWTRESAVPNDKVLAYAPDPVNMPNAVAAGVAVTGASDEKILEAVRVQGTPRGTY